MMFLLHAWVSAERQAGTLNMHLVTSFDFSGYPACGLSRSSNCIQAIRFYDPMLRVGPNRTAKVVPVQSSEITRRHISP